jgi:hypothetical protein
MSTILDKYNKRLCQRNIHSNDITILKDIESHNPKFESNGKIKPFYGSTCIAWIDKQSDLFKRLWNLQQSIQNKFEQAGVKDMFTFLEPTSLHMTICDIDASTDYSQVKPLDHVKHIQRSLAQIGRIGKIQTHIQGIGLNTSITALVQFNNKCELEKVLDLEQRIKIATNTDCRNFVGHISLAYFVQYPGEKIQTIKDILLPFEDQFIGDFTFSKFDFTYFRDMNTYLPLLTINLLNSKVIRHEHQLKELKPYLYSTS